ncbi:MAG: RNA polymerase sigma factor [Acidobacteriota bacterium]|nr:RNA polymerase sigma factor [Acidobacteriota bacterium]
MTVSKQEIFLILRAQSGDKQAFDELLKSIQAALFRYIFRLVGEYALAEDILQEVFIIIYRKIRWLENPKLFRAWVYRIASRETFKHLKKEKRWSEQLRDEEILEKVPVKTSEEIYEPELIEKLPTLMSEVSPASRAVLILHYLDETPLSEVAEILNISLGTVKSRLAYGLTNLRQKIKREK